MPSGGGQPAQTTQISKVELPAWVDQASQQNYQLAKNVSDRPFAQYQGSRVADPSQYTTQGYDQIQSNIGAANPYVDMATNAYNRANSLYDDSAGMYKSTAPLYDQAQTQFGKAGSVLDQSMPLFGQAADIYRSTAGPLDINQFLNPYTNEVEQRAIGNANTALTQQMAGNASAAEKAGAFGGSRFAVQQGVTQGEGIRNIGDLSAQLRKAGIDFATQTALQDRTGRQAAAGGLLNTAGGMGGASDRYMNTGTGYLNTAAGIRDTAAGIGNTAGGVAGTGTGYLGAANTKLSGNAQDIQSLMMAGNQDTAQRQSVINADMQKFQEQQDYPVQQLNMRLAALGMSPYGKTETSNKTSTSEDKGPDWATIGLGALKTIPSLVAMSDREAKTDITKLTDGDIPMYSYRYKGDPKSYPKIVGPMAQDVEKKFPSAVKKIGKYKTINYSNLMEVLS
jgi:hypothetical protein